MSFTIVVSGIRSVATEIEMLADGQALDVNEYSPTTLTFHLNDMLAVGLLLSIKAHIVAGTVHIEFFHTAQVLSCQATGEGTFRTEVQLRQFDKLLWSRFLDSVSSRQQQVDELFNAMKGLA